jgi:hypothetical protein
VALSTVSNGNQVDTSLDDDQQTNVAGK